MSQSHACVWIHLVFSTKERRAYLQHEPTREELFAMLGYFAKEAKCPPVRVGGHIDHVHLLCGLARTCPISDLVEHVKTESSKWIKTKRSDLRNFAWQAGYGVFSVSHSALPRVTDYIINQPLHHAKRSFQAEYRALCKRHEIEIDERYVWD